MIVYFAWDGFGKVMHQSIPPAPSPSPPYYCLVSPGGGAFANFSLPGGRAFANAGAIPELSNTHAVSHQNKTTQRVLLEKKQIGLSVKDRNKLKRVVRACSRFYACISSLHCFSSQSYIAKLELSMWINVINININIIWKTSFHKYKTIHNI